MENQKKMQFYGGTFGACLPLLVFMALMITIAALQKVSLVLFCMAGFAGLCTAFLLAKDKKEFEKAVVAGLKNDTLCVIIFAFLLAGVLSQELRQSGLIQGLTWLVTELGLSAGFLPLVGFIICALISTACGTSNGALWLFCRCCCPWPPPWAPILPLWWALSSAAPSSATTWPPFPIPPSPLP